MELREYETTLAKHYKEQKIKSLPLISWDFYSIFFNQTRDSFSDSNLLTKIISQNKAETNWSFSDELQHNTVIVVTDTNLEIVFASKNMILMNGYKPEEVVGKTPRMFQGELTDTTISKEIGSAIKNKQPFEKTVINYCKDGAIYKCHIKGFPIFNKDGELTNFIAFEKIAA
ncbi:PAS domain-containing protein [Flavobacterium sp. SUN052]|uniref:PAS domain-containing protein n=1 Tax=Flavobacterium sp. SUN052 TaxID=3002441 RepID=UPI00237E844C|nr:PAS domain-containing protein [Flavobacterium sp. SUN052]MEC4004250.1 PAS domain-containing protein [Flavobacterium sp. SUN052]